MTYSLDEVVKGLREENPLYGSKARQYIADGMEQVRDYAVDTERIVTDAEKAIEEFKELDISSEELNSYINVLKSQGNEILADLENVNLEDNKVAYLANLVYRVANAKKANMTASLVDEVAGSMTYLGSAGYLIPVDSSSVGGAVDLLKFNPYMEIDYGDGELIPDSGSASVEVLKDCTVSINFDVNVCAVPSGSSQTDDSELDVVVVVTSPSEGAKVIYSVQGGVNSKSLTWWRVTEAGITADLKAGDKIAVFIKRTTSTKYTQIKYRDCGFTVTAAERPKQTEKPGDEVSIQKWVPTDHIPTADELVDGVIMYIGDEVT